MTNKLEILLRKAGRELADHQVCRFFKIPEEMAQTPCDFMGYTKHGRAIMIEAKMVNRTSLPINDTSNGLSIHQWNELCDANRAGAIALICWARGDVCATLPIDLAIQLSKDRASIPWAAIQLNYRHPMSGPKAHLCLLEPWIAIS